MIIEMKANVRNWT